MISVSGTPCGHAHLVGYLIAALRAALQQVERHGRARVAFAELDRELDIDRDAVAELQRLEGALELFDKVGVLQQTRRRSAPCCAGPGPDR